jgi:MFS family permease
MVAQGNNNVGGRAGRGPEFPSAPAGPTVGSSAPLEPRRNGRLDTAPEVAADAARETEAQARSRWGVLRHKHYRRVLLAQWFSNLGTWSEFFAIQMFLAKTTGRLDDQGILGVCQQAPIFALGLLGGVASDRVNRRTLLVVTQVLAGLVAAGVAFVTTVHFQNPRHAVYWLYALGVAYGVVMAFNFPAWQVVTPRLVPKDELTKAITLNGIQFNLARAVGPAITGLVLAHYAPAWVLGFNALTFLAMAAVVMTTPDAPAPPHSGNSWAQEIGEARRYLMRSPGPRAVLIAMVAFSALAAPLVRLLSNFVIDVYGLSQGAAPGAPSEAEAVGGKLLGTMGLGAVIAGITLKMIPRWYPKHHFIPLSAIGLGLSICVFALTTKIWAGYVAMTVCGWFWIWAFNQTWAALSVLTPDRLRGRAMSVMNVLSFGATALGVWVAGEAGEHAKTLGVTAQHATQGAILLLSVPLVLAGLVMLMFRVPEIDEMPRRGAMGLLDRLDVVEAITARTHRPGNGSDVDRAEPV